MLGPSSVPELPIRGMSLPSRRHRIWKDIPSLGHSEPLDACGETADGHYLCHLTHTTRPRLYSLMSLWWTWEHPFCLSWLFHLILSVGIAGAHKWWRRFLSFLFCHILGIVELRFCRETRFDPSANIGCSFFLMTWYYCKKKNLQTVWKGFQRKRERRRDYATGSVQYDPFLFTTRRLSSSLHVLLYLLTSKSMFCVQRKDLRRDLSRNATLSCNKCAQTMDFWHGTTCTSTASHPHFILFFFCLEAQLMMEFHPKHLFTP